MSAKELYTMELENRGDYLWVLVGGDQLTASIAADYWRRIAAECHESECRKVLIEKNFRKPVGPAEMLEMADILGSLLPGQRIAFYDRYDHSSINELGKKLARNRDVMMQTFKSVHDAEKWLRAN